MVILNVAWVRGFNGLDTLFFNVPAQYPIHAYTFRAMLSMTPEDHVAAITAPDTRINIPHNEAALPVLQAASIG